MNEFFQYGAVVLWVVLAVLTFIIGKKHGAAGYLLSVFFVFMAVWYGLSAFGKLPMFDGAMSYVFRGILLVFLLLIVFAWYRMRTRQAQSAKQHKDGCNCDDCRNSHKDELHVD
jgi:hypothetical protein